MTINLRIASGVRSGSTAVDAFDAHFGRYSGRTGAPDVHLPEPSMPEGSAVLEPPRFAPYSEAVRDVPVEQLTGLDVNPRQDNALPYVPR